MGTRRAVPGPGGCVCLEAESTQLAGGHRCRATVRSSPDTAWAGDVGCPTLNAEAPAAQPGCETQDPPCPSQGHCPDHPSKTLD